jgi:hypothetical protein
MTDFSADCVDCKVYYKPGFFDHDVEKVDDVHHKIRRFKSVDHYIKSFIEHVKHNVIKQFPNLSLLKIYLHVFDDGNIIHRLIVTVANMLRDILKYKKRISFKQSVFVIITYEGHIVFTGNLSFAGLLHISPK